MYYVDEANDLKIKWYNKWENIKLWENFQLHLIKVNNYQI
jgi:hypothetical protein